MTAEVRRVLPSHRSSTVRACAPVDFRISVRCYAANLPPEARTRCGYDHHDPCRDCRLVNENHQRFVTAFQDLAKPTDDVWSKAKVDLAMFGG